MTVAQRLMQLSSLPAGTAVAAEHLRIVALRFRLATGTVAVVLMAYIGLPAGSTTALQHLMVEGARVRGYRPADGNEADALALLHWALDQPGVVQECAVRGDEQKGSIEPELRKGFA